MGAPTAVLGHGLGAGGGSGHVAAHSPDTAAVGQAVLADGGTAADAVAAMVLAACAAEPLVVSLLSGMHAITVDPSGRVRAVDGFVDVPAQPTGGRVTDTQVVFDDEPVPYQIGGGTFGVPGLVAGCEALVADHGRLPWAAVVQPAVEVARRGVVLGAADERLLGMLAAVMRLDAGGAVFCTPDGALRTAGDRLLIAELPEVLTQLAEEGPRSLVDGELAVQLAAFCGERGATVAASDLARVVAVRHTPPAVALGGAEVRSRRGLSPLLGWVAALDATPADAPAVVRLATAQGPAPHVPLGTTSMAAVDADGRACAATASLGLGTGDWFRGCQLNSMLGERDLLPGGLVPGRRMGSMMAPTAVLRGGRAVAVLGAAGGSRIPSAVLRVLDGVVRLGLPAEDAVELPRLHRSGRVVHVEPHLPAADADALAAAGFEVRRWATRSHFFGGVAIATPADACGDPRRDGSALVA